LDEQSDVSTDKMKNVSRLYKDIDSLKDNNIRVVTNFSKNITNRMGAFLPSFEKDTLTKPAIATLAKIDSIKWAKDSLANLPISGKPDPNINVTSLFGRMQKLQLYNSAQNSVNNILNSIKGKKEELGKRYKIY